MPVVKRQEQLNRLPATFIEPQIRNALPILRLPTTYIKTPEVLSLVWAYCSLIQQADKPNGLKKLPSFSRKRPLPFFKKGEAPAIEICGILITDTKDITTQLYEGIIFSGAEVNSKETLDTILQDKNSAPLIEEVRKVLDETPKVYNTFGYVLYKNLLGDGRQVRGTNPKSAGGIVGPFTTQVSALARQKQGQNKVKWFGRKGF